MAANKDEHQLYEVLKKVFGYDSFKGNQEAIIRSVLANNDTFVITVLPAACPDETGNSHHRLPAHCPYEKPGGFHPEFRHGEQCGPFHEFFTYQAGNYPG